jgi:hypothetical protein
MDVKQIGDQMYDGAAGIATFLTSGSWMVFGVLALGAAWLIFSGAGKDKGPSLAVRLREAVFTNWRLALLGTTSVLLSLVAGYTTFDGLRNFTGGGTLSFLATFGIQGVMLVTAWLIGESFATGMNQQPVRATQPGFSRSAQAIGGGIIGALLFITVLVLMVQTTGQSRQPGNTITWAQFADKALIFVVGLLLAGLVVLYSASDLVKPYLQSARVIIKNIILWVMFLFCMSVSVFFSFDSHFSGIFPMEERVRASELRAQNQVAGIVADIGTTIQTRQATEADDLFKHDGWKAYDRNLADLAKASQGAERDIEAYFVQQMEARRSAIAQQQERITSAISSQAGLSSKKTTLTDEVSRLKGERPALAADLSEKKSELDNRVKAIDAKRVEAMAEDKGVEGTGKAGRGPVYRERMGELAKMQEYVKIQDDRVRDATRRLNTVDTRIAQIERELAATDGDIAKLRGEAQTAESRIKVAEESKTGEEGPKVDPARVRLAFETARMDFRQDPTADRLGHVQRLCAQLYGALAATPATRDRVRGIDCDPKTASEAAARVFALNDGIMSFGKQCQGGDKLTPLKTADSLFDFARKCLADSGLPSADTDTMRSKINFIELNRDDKAHRFIVTWNAFQDGNRLAYLALAIAITIDGLVFMSGLFGANAVRSPLSDVPSTKARSGRQLEAIIDTALIPHKFETARLVLGAMKPMTQRDGHMARVEIDDHDPHAADLRRVLNAGTTIGAVRHAEDNPNVYEIRSELFEYLSAVAKKEFDANKEHVSLAELERTVMVALLPAEKVQYNSEMILSYMHPIREDRGFMAEIRLEEVRADDEAQGTGHLRTVRNALNAGATFDRIQRVGQDDASHYYVHGDFYKTLVRIRGRLLSSAAHRPAIGGPSSGNGGPAYGGKLHDPVDKLGPTPQRRQIQPPKPSADTVAALQDSAPAPPSPARSVADDDRAYLYYWSELVSVLGINPQHALQRRHAPGAQQQAQEVWNTLNQLADHNSTLAGCIEEHKEAQEEARAHAYSRLRNHANGDKIQLDALERADIDFDRDLSVFMLYPENGLLDYLVASLERAAAPDDGILPGEQKLLNELRSIRATLREADLSDPDTWTRVGQVLQDVAADQRAQIARFAPGGDKRTLN